MKKLGILLLIFALFAGVSNVAVAATGSETVDVNLDILSTLALDCDNAVTMGAITGTGQSALGSNIINCNIKTNNTAGYRLDWQASEATMANANADTIASYTPASAGVPEAWSVAGTDSEWGARVNTTNSTAAAIANSNGTPNWGATDTYAGNFLNVTTATGFRIAGEATETAAAGSDVKIMFGAEVGATKWQPTGTYDVDVIMTATTL